MRQKRHCCGVAVDAGACVLVCLFVVLIWLATLSFCVCSYFLLLFQTRIEELREEKKKQIG